MFNNEPMRYAIKEARQAALLNEIPVGAAIIKTDSMQIVSSGYNCTRKMSDPTAHAEIIAIRSLSQEIGYNLSGYSMFVTLEPCHMCAGAISMAKLDAVYIGTTNEKYGAIYHGGAIYEYTTHKPEYYLDIMHQECSNLLIDFFKELR